MKNEEKLFDEVESYVLGFMSTDERADFERQLAMDAELQNLVHKQREIAELSIDAGVLELKNKLKSGHFSTNRWTKVWPWLGFGAVVVLVGWYSILSLKQPVMPQQIAIEQQTVSIEEDEKQTETKATQGLKASRKGFLIPETEKNTNATIPEENQLQTLDTVPLLRGPFTTPVLQIIDHTIPEGLPIVKNETHLKKENPTETQGKVFEQPQTPVRKKDFMFQPNLGETWNFPIPDDKVGEIRIFDSNGQPIFDSKVGRNHLTEWNGTNQNGGLVGAGNYVYILTFDREIVEGNITVVR